MINKIKELVKDVPKAELVLWYAVRAVLLIGILLSQTTSGRLLALAALLASFSISLCRILFSKESFLGSLSLRIQTLICTAAFFGSFVGKCLGVLDKYPDYDIFLHILAGIVGVGLGYYITVALNKPQTKTEIVFTIFSSAAISCFIACFREIVEFLIDFRTGSNLVRIDRVGDDHWLYRLFGKGMTDLIPEQQRILDTDEDMTIAVFTSFIAVGVLYLWLRSKNKELYVKQKRSFHFSFLGIPSRIKAKCLAEVDKIRKDCNVCDLIVWWGVRAAMIYAAFNMPNMAEAILLSANLIGTFAITLLHMLTGEKNPLNKLSYRVQTVVSVIVFLGSYCGNYIYLYGVVPRYDLFLHFISGALSVTGGYYLSKTLFEIKNRKQALLSAIFSFCFSGMVIPAHEIVEFIGDFIWGTTNQGFDWDPLPESFFFKIFGQGAGDLNLYSLFDTMYDMMLAFSMAFISVVVLYISLRITIRKKEKDAAAKTEIKTSVTC